MIERVDGEPPGSATAPTPGPVFAESSLRINQNHNTVLEIRPCGCWFVNLAQGPAVLVCREHEQEVSRVCR